MGAEEVVTSSPADAPKISVITINRNMRDGLEATIKSVLGQTHSNLEYIVIDGNSSDGSVELIGQFASRIHYSLSEPDTGIYDAMNKGVRVSTGEWVIFMNAGDRFHDGEVVKDVFSSSHSDTDLIYGHSLRSYVREKVERIVPAESLAALPLRMNCSHQSLFARRSLLVEYPFSLELMASDYEFLVRMYTQGRRFKTVDRIIGVNASGGISDVNRLRSLAERARIAMRHGLMTPRFALSYVGMGLRAGLGPHVKRSLPKRLATWILQRKIVD